MRFLGNEWGNEDLAGLRTIVVPSGIGEFQWSWTKYLNVADEDFCILGLDGAPRRLHQFCELHPRIKAFGFTTAFDYTSIRAWQKEFKLDTWESVRSQFDLGQMVALACNPHLEAGRPLAEWMPDLATTYRYKLELSEEHRRIAQRYLLTKRHDDVLIGISCASYRGADAWKTWHATAWLEFLGLIQKEVPNAKFVLIGGSWDDLTASVYDEDSGLRWLTDSRGLPPTGRTSFGAAVALLEGLDGYIGFSSGLGHVAAHNCGTPVFMLWPEHEDALMTSWVDPELLENGSYVPSHWHSPTEVFRRTKQWLRRLV
jgi:hypothetical protein